MLRRFIRSRILRNFYAIDLNKFERRMADEAVEKKYAVSVSIALRYSLLLLPALLLLDTGVVLSVLIPTTMVAGTAWFAVSLANMRQKFENFGMELTRDLFVAFSLSLMMLFLASVISLTAFLWEPYCSGVIHPGVKMIAVVLAIGVVGKLLYSIFVGSLKYDINDTMLTGQNEAAEMFFRRSISLLYTTSQQLREGMDLQVANYSLGLAFYEIFNNIKEVQAVHAEEMNSFIAEANKLLEKPSMAQKNADIIVLNLIKAFIGRCSTREEILGHRSYQAVIFEYKCLKNNMDKGPQAEGFEKQKMVDTRMAVIFLEISNLIEEFGISLFEKI